MKKLSITINKKTNKAKKNKKEKQDKEDKVDKEDKRDKADKADKDVKNEKQAKPRESKAEKQPKIDLKSLVEGDKELKELLQNLSTLWKGRFEDYGDEYNLQIKISTNEEKEDIKFSWSQ